MTRASPDALVGQLASTLVLGALLDRVQVLWGTFELLSHWQQGEFHHDVVIGLTATPGGPPGGVLVVQTNCNGGVKEVSWFGSVPDRSALWHARCPENPEFSGTTPDMLALARTPHWFDPCELLSANARSEYREEHRVRQSGGGWLPRR